MISPEEQLRRQYGKHGIYAGSTHFHDYWCRDSMFASLGALAIGDYEIVGKTLDNFLNNLREDGHVAMRIGSTSQILRYLGFPTKHGVHHRQDKGNNSVYDSNSLLLIVAQIYEHKSGRMLDREKMKEVVRWLDDHDRDGLLHEKKYASWDDSLKLTGARLYTNVCYYKALLAAADLLTNPIYLKRAEHTKSEIQKWWNGDYFSDGANAACMPGGNLLAIIWGVCEREQSDKILKRIADRDSIVPPAGFWHPTWREVFLPFYLINMTDYHGKMEWSWLAGAEIAAYRSLGNNKEADKRYEAVLGLIERYGTLYEVYEEDRPVNRLIYRSEKDFAWGLGMLLASRSGDGVRY
jgi:glycogen debranching enzyme